MGKGKGKQGAASTPLVVPAEPAKDKAAEAAAKAATKAAAAAARAEAKEAAKAARAGALAEAHERLRALREAEAAKRHCLCGCGATTPTAFFVPGHDAKLVSRWLSEAEAKAAA